MIGLHSLDGRVTPFGKQFIFVSIDFHFHSTDKMDLIFFSGVHRFFPQLHGDHRPFRHPQLLCRRPAQIALLKIQGHF